MIKINGFGHIFAEGGIQRQQEQKVPPVHHAWNGGYPKVREDFTITKKAPTRAFS